MLGPIGTQELLIIAFLILLLFGAKKIPGLARGLGNGMREFREAKREVTNEIDDAKAS